MNNLFNNNQKRVLHFDDIKNYEAVRDPNIVNTIEFLFYDLRDKKGNPIDPVAKQSIKSMIYKHHQPKSYDKVYGGPVNKGEPKLFFGRDGVRYVYEMRYQPAKVRNYEEYLKKLAMEQLPSGFFQFQKIVIVEEIVFAFRFLSSHPKKLREKYDDGIVKLKTTSPDLAENLNKAVWDALEGTVIKNDSLIASIEKQVKIYAPVSYIYIKLRGK